MTIPVAIIVCEGDVQTVAHTAGALQHKLPVIIMKGSGQAADLILAYLERFAIYVIYSSKCHLNTHDRLVYPDSEMANILKNHYVNIVHCILYKCILGDFCHVSPIYNCKLLGPLLRLPRQKYEFLRESLSLRFAYLRFVVLD